MWLMGAFISRYECNAYREAGAGESAKASTRLRPGGRGNGLRVHRVNVGDRASTGPRPGGRGNARCGQRVAEKWNASTRPRPGGRGNVNKAWAC
jgi:hypothetical protein